MLNCKRINPKWLIIIIITILTMIYYTNRTITNTYCLEQYNIVKCPSELYLETYIIEAENDDEALKKTQQILTSNNFLLDNYEITIQENNIKINEKTGTETEAENETTTEKTENIEETQENNNEIMLMIDYVRDQKITTKSGESYYLPKEYKNYKYVMFWEISPQNNSLLFFNNYTINSYNKTENAINMTVKEGIRLLYINQETLKEQGTTSATIFEETNGYYTLEKMVFTNFNIEDTEKNIVFEKNIIEENTGGSEEENTEGGTEINVDLGEVNANLEDIKKILVSICIMFSVCITYSFTCSVLGNRK